jgi:hypothetical protein
MSWRLKKELVLVLILFFAFSAQAMAITSKKTAKTHHKKSAKKVSKHSAHSAHTARRTAPKVVGNHMTSPSKKRGPQPASVLPEKESSTGAARVRRDYFQGSN